MTPWTAAHQVPLSMGFSRQDYWNGLPFSPPGLCLGGGGGGAHLTIIDPALIMAYWKEKRLVLDNWISKPLPILLLRSVRSSGYLRGF